MKKNLILILLMGYMSIYANEIKTVVDGKVRFEIPSSEKIDFGRKEKNPLKVSILINEIKNEELKGYTPQSFSPFLYMILKDSDFRINKAEIIKMIEENDVEKTNTFSIEPNYYYDYDGKLKNTNRLLNSYKKLIYADQCIGESFLYLSPIKYAKDKYFNIDSNINFVLNDRIVYIRIENIWGDAKKVAEAFPDFFEIREDGKTYWINQAAQNKFIEKFNSDEYKKLPETIRLVRETRDTILSTLQINEAGFKD